jgi:hypothetical protein
MHVVARAFYGVESPGARLRVTQGVAEDPAPTRVTSFMCRPGTRTARPRICLRNPPYSSIARSEPSLARVMSRRSPARASSAYADQCQSCVAQASS